jgi:hypothetical protein
MLPAMRLALQAAVAVAILAAGVPASARGKTRRGIRWTASAKIVQDGEKPAVQWTLEARNSSRRKRALPCFHVLIASYNGSYDVKGKFTMKDGAGFGMTAEPATECFNDAPSELARGASWSLDLPPARVWISHGGVSRVIITLRVGDDDLDLAAVDAFADEDGSAKLVPATTRVPDLDID